MKALVKILYNLSPFILCILGFIMFCYPLALFEQLPGDLGDARFINYLLEHGWLWLHKYGVHTRFWDIPMFYPNTNTLSFSDMMIGGMILYAPIRLFVNNPQNALAVWFILLCLLNYFSSYLVLRKGFNFDKFVSAVGAFIFAFGLVRQNRICHMQLMTQFFMMFSILGILLLDKSKSKLWNNCCFLITMLFFVLQIYTSFYLGWFMVFGTVVLILLMAIIPELKTKLYNFIKSYKYEIIGYSIICIILLIPLVEHYIAVGAQQPYSLRRLAQLLGIFSSSSILDNLFSPSSSLVEHEYRMGMGYFTSIISILGIIFCKNHRKYIFSYIGIILAFFTILPLNFLLYTCFPGESAIRAGGRIILLLLPIYVYGLANFIKNLKNKKYLFIILILILIEQITPPNMYNWTKQEHEQRLTHYHIPKECKSVYYDIQVSPDYSYLNDILWATTIYNNAYSVNGYSGYFPKINPNDASKNCQFIINKNF